MPSRKKSRKTAYPGKQRSAAFSFKIGLLNSTDDKKLTVGSDPLVTALRQGMNDAAGTKVEIVQRSAKGRYGKKKFPKVLDGLADELVVVEHVQLIVASGGIVSARAAAAAGAKTSPPTPVLVCLGQADATLPTSFVAGVNLNTPGQDNYRGTLLKTRNGLSSEDNIWLVVNSNSAMGKSERDQWDAAGRPFVETGRSGDNDEGRLSKAFEYAVDDGAEAFILSSDPFFTSKAKKLFTIIKGTNLPACFPFKEYLDGQAPDQKYVSWGPSLVDAYVMLGEQAIAILTPTGPFPQIVVVPSTQFPP
jgi:hypothetical protein